MICAACLFVSLEMELKLLQLLERVVDCSSSSSCLSFGEVASCFVNYLTLLLSVEV